MGALLLCLKEGLLLASTHVASLLAPPDCASILGANINLITGDELLEKISQTVRSDNKIVVAHHNLHSLCLFNKHIADREKFHDFYRLANVTVADGMSMVALGRMFGQPITRDNRIAYNDWLPVILPIAVQNHWRIFYLGSSPEVAELGAQKLRAEYPGLEFEVHHGHFDTRSDGEENQKVLIQIEACRPHLLFVGMGMPRQECWLEENIQKIAANVILTSGGTLDYIAGDKRMAPRWIGRIGLEWLFRLATEPRRLAYRYLVEPWTLVRALLSHS
jgi:N-acetylglucosaminyldiphosphoundecaprenol N-acetyl-beta-D-mannosaminyltransferase